MTAHPGPDGNTLQATLPKFILPCLCRVAVSLSPGNWVEHDRCVLLPHLASVPLS